MLIGQGLFRAIFLQLFISFGITLLVVLVRLCKVSLNLILVVFVNKGNPKIKYIDPDILCTKIQVLGKKPDWVYNCLTLH